MSLTQQIFTVFAVMLGTMLTRFLPFIVFPADKKPPVFIQYLGKVLPYAVMGMLIVFCLRDAFSSEFKGLFEVLGILFIVVLHKWKKNTLLSIGGGTIFYMFLVQTFSL